MEAPERVYFQPGFQQAFLPVLPAERSEIPVTEYIRADLVENLVEALRGVINACNQGRMVPRPGCGVGGMTIDANIRGSVYTGVPAWPIEEAQTTLAEWENIK